MTFDHDIEKLPGHGKPCSDEQIIVDITQKKLTTRPMSTLRVTTLVEKGPYVAWVIPEIKLDAFHVTVEKRAEQSRKNRALWNSDRLTIEMRTNLARNSLAQSWATVESQGMIITFTKFRLTCSSRSWRIVSRSSAE